MLIIPALLIAGLAFYLLNKEAERMNDYALESAKEQVALSAEAMRIAATEIQDGIISQLEAINHNDLIKSLWDLEYNNPLIRNTFIWRQPNYLIKPNVPEQRSGEKSDFVSRYKDYFNGNLNWFERQAAETPLQTAATEELGKSQSLSRFLKRTRSEVKKSREIYETKQQSAQIELDADMPQAVRLPLDSIWVNMMDNNRSFALAVIQNPNTGFFYGAELEWIAFLSRIIAALANPELEGASYCLKDGTGNIIHQTGLGEITPELQALSSVKIGPLMPGYEIAIYNIGTGVNPQQRSFLLLTGLLTLLVLTALISGGIMLMRQAQENLKEAQLKTNFVSNVSHELKTPLTTIRMYAELLAEGRVQEEEKQNKYLHTIVDESQRLTRLVNNVLDFSRLEQGRKKYNLENLCPVAFLTDFMETQKLRLEQHDIRLNIQIPENISNVTADSDALEQIITNLVDNVIKYAANGKSYDLNIEEKRDYVEICFCDKGPGVPEDKLKHIFGKFVQLDDELTAEKSGSGLGLSIASTLAKDMGATLIAKNNPEGGACFCLQLPKANGATA